MQQAVRDVLIALMTVAGQAPTPATKGHSVPGIDHARHLGSGGAPMEEYEIGLDLLGQGTGTSEVAPSTGLSRQAMLRIKADEAWAEAAPRAWGS
jgi:putative DNA-invertase from lambdoid prophage Rac